MVLPITVATATILMPSMGVRFLVRRLASGHPVLPVTTDWLNELSPDRYRPMLHLLDETDFQFLRSRQGFTPQMVRRLRRGRVRKFRRYLHMLAADFDRVATALRLILAQSAYDRPELASHLFRLQVKFAFGLMGIQFRLLLFGLGSSGVDVSSLIQLFDGMRLELRTLVPASSRVVV